MSKNYLESEMIENKREPASIKDIMEDNCFLHMTTEELKEVWQQYRSFCTNGYTIKGTTLDKIRAKLCLQTAFGVIIMEKQLLYAIAVDHFMKEEKQAYIESLG